MDKTTLEELFSILANARARVYLAGERTDLVRKESDGSLTVGLEKEAADETVLHEAGHVLYSPFNWTERLGLTSVHPSVQSIANAIEDARIDRRTSQHFGRDITEYERSALGKALAEKKITRFPVRALLSRAYGVLTAYDAEEQALLNAFGDDIDAAVTSDETLASVRLALRIGYYLKLREERKSEGAPVERDEGVKREHSKETHDEASELADTAPAPHKPAKDNEEEREEREEHAAAAAEEIDREHKEDEEAAEKDAEHATSLADATLERALKKSLPRLSRAIEEAEARKSSVGEAPLPSSGSAVSHTYKILELEMEPLIASEQTRLLLGGLEGDGMRGARTRGIPTPRVWRLGFGDRRVYARPPKVKSRSLVALVDLSGSMNCWCETHETHRTNTNGWLAFQCVAALQRATPDIRVFGFCSDESASFIVPIPSGQRPICRFKKHVPIGNPDCVALEFLQELLVNGVDGTTAVIISDGAPVGPAPLDNKHLAEHTRTLAKQMAEAGLRFASILIGRASDSVYPSAVVAHVNKQDDIANLGHLLAWLKREEE